MDIRPDWTEALADRYRIEKEIGRGGMASVYLAEDLRYRRKVAVKVLREELAHALAHDRFLEEIRTAARLSHPGIVPVYDSGLIPAAPGRPALPWFAMMYIEGESLKERLARGPLPLADAVDIARAVAAALDYAHGEQVIHRDIKPGNILLAADAAVVADFGIARAVDRAGDDSFTATGLTVGTPHYISPEQASAEPTLDHRTDIYALGCVAYEMLAGQPPFSGPNPQAIVARHNLDPPPPLGTVRPSVPPGTVLSIERALAKRPEDRWPTAGAFAHALRETTEHPVRTAPIPVWHRAWWTRRRVGVAAAALAAVALGAGYLVANDRPGEGAGAAADSTGKLLDTYAILTPSMDEGGRAALLLIASAIERWGGTTVLLEQAAAGADGSAAGVRSALRVASQSRAGRLVVPRLARGSDSLLLRLALWDTRTGRALGTAEAGIAGAGARIVAARVETLVDGLVLGQFGSPRACSHPQAPVALASLRSFSRADSLMAEWRLQAAADSFAAAAAADPSLAPAFLCRALLMSWTETDDLLWGGMLVRLASDSARLPGRDRGVLAALAARQEGRLLAACTAWRGLAARHPDDFVAQYGLADCLVSDHGVVRDRRSPTGWRFRSDYGEALEAFGRAVSQNPDVYRALAPGALSAARKLLSSQREITRNGTAVPPDTGTFNAQRAMMGDSVAYLPVRTLDFAAGGTEPEVAAARTAAIAREYEVLYRHIANWRASRPGEVMALVALAEALEVRGDRSALDSLRLARELAVDPTSRFAISTAEVFLLVRLGLPSDSRRLSEAARLADSLLASATVGAGVAYDRAALAALRGRGIEAASGWRAPELTRRLQVPVYLKDIAPALQVFAAMGGPVDSLRELERKVESAIRRNFASADQLRERMRWIALPAAIAWPQFTFATIANVRGHGDPILDAIVADLDGDSAAVRRLLQPYWDGRERIGAQMITLDGLRTEAQLRWRAGERDRAIRLLDESLGSLFGLGPGGLQDPLQAAGLIRAAALRAEYAAALGEGGLAREWASAVRRFWADAEPVSRELVRGALDLTSHGGP